MGWATQIWTKEAVVRTLIHDFSILARTFFIWNNQKNYKNLRTFYQNRKQNR